MYPHIFKNFYENPNITNINILNALSVKIS